MSPVWSGVLLLLFTETVYSMEMEVHLGRAQYELVQQDSQLPRFGTCWQMAIRNLHQGCRSLTDLTQSRLALEFANCFLIQSGQPAYPCRSDQEVRSCIRDISSNAFTAYSNFFTHTQHMCQFLQAQVWREHTENTIGRLSRTSAEVAQSMNVSSSLQQKIIQHQMETLQHQRQILAEGNVLSQALEMSKASVKDILHEFRLSTDEQKMLIFSIFDRVSQLQNLVVSEVSWIYSMLFYGLSMMVLYLVSATKRTGEARLWLFAVLTVNFLLERYICSTSLPDDARPEEGVSQLIADRIWLLRKVSLAVCGLLVFYFATTYKDYNLINHKLLQDISRQNQSLCNAVELLKSLQHGKDTSDASSPLKLSWPFVDKDQLLSEESGSEVSSDCSTLSFVSTQTDRTWLAPSHDDEQDLYSSDAGSDDSDLHDGFVDDTDFTAKLVAPIIADTSGSSDSLSVGSWHTVVDEHPISGLATSGSSRLSTPLRTVHNYNLRQRKNVADNPLLRQESPDSFGRLVNSLAHMARKHSQKIRRSVHEEAAKCQTRRIHTSGFSSDEELK